MLSNNRSHLFSINIYLRNKLFSIILKVFSWLKTGPRRTNISEGFSRSRADRKHFSRVGRSRQENILWIRFGGFSVPPSSSQPRQNLKKQNGRILKSENLPFLNFFLCLDLDYNNNNNNNRCQTFNLGCRLELPPFKFQWINPVMSWV